MAVTASKVQLAQENFAKHPNNNSVALFFSLLREAEQEGSIDDDVFHNGLAAVEEYLWKAPNGEPA